MSRILPVLLAAALAASIGCASAGDAGNDLDAGDDVVQDVAVDDGATLDAAEAEAGAPDLALDPVPDPQHDDVVAEAVDVAADLPGDTPADEAEAPCGTAEDCASKPVPAGCVAGWWSCDAGACNYHCGEAPDVVETVADAPETSCAALIDQIGANAAAAAACAKSADCTLLPVGAICDSMPCVQVAIASAATQEQRAAVEALGAQGLELKCPAFGCGCGLNGQPACIDQACALCPGPRCTGTCQGLRNAAMELALASTTCQAAQECWVPDVSVSCGIAVRRYTMTEATATALATALSSACGGGSPCQVAPGTYPAACLKGTCQRLDSGTACTQLHDWFTALVAAPASQACTVDTDCVATSFLTQPFCTTECGCAVVTNKGAAQWAGVLATEYQSQGCPGDPCGCIKCMKVAKCVAGVCQ